MKNEIDFEQGVDIFRKLKPRVKACQELERIDEIIGELNLCDDDNTYYAEIGELITLINSVMRRKHNFFIATLLLNHFFYTCGDDEQKRRLKAFRGYIQNLKENKYIERRDKNYYRR